MALAAIFVGLAGLLPISVGAAPCPIVELRQYTLHDGQRDTLIDLFEHHFIEPQEALGMTIIGTFRDLDRPNRFVWIRGFPTMESRLHGLGEFYGGEVWKAHRDAANATMIDSDNVLLLHAPSSSAAFGPFAKRPGPGEKQTAGIIVATIHLLKSRPADAGMVFEHEVKPRLEKTGIPVLGWFISGMDANNYPRLPVRESEKVLVWFSRFDDALDEKATAPAIAAAQMPLGSMLAGETELLRLAPTARSELR